MAVDFRWSQSSNRLYVNGPGTVTLSDIKVAQVLVPLEQTAPGVWHLRANLILQQGAQLLLHGVSLGGDVNELRLQSNNTTNGFVCISADWGSLHLQGTTVTSWDDAANGPDTEYETFGRAYLGVRSSLAADGVTAQESRMDIIDSEIGYLGYNGSESYGLTWKVIGAHPDPTLSIFDFVNVYGDILNSRIHHNYFGVYTYGHYGGHWANNEVDHNAGYGLDPHDDSDYLVIEKNQVHDNGWDGIIASKRCDHLIIRDNVSRANGQNGIILHRSSNDCVVENNQSLDNGTTGIVITGGWRCVVRGNLLARNAEAGLRLDLGSADNLIENNLCESNALYGLYLYKSSDLPEPDDDARPKRNRFVNNRIQHNQLDGLNLADSDDNVFATNVFYDNGTNLSFRRGYRNRLDGNDIPVGVTVKTLGSMYDRPVTYISNQWVLRIQVDSRSSTIFEDADGRIFDPEEKGATTTASTVGSTLALTAAEIGTTSTVIARSLWGRPSEGAVLINPRAWTNANQFIRQWGAQSETPTQQVTYVVGDLEAGRSYIVSKAGIPFATLSSDANRVLTFTDVAGVTNEVLYTVEPGPKLRFEKMGGNLVISWPAGQLQRATSLSPPNWQDVITTNGQFSVPFNPYERMELFRLIQTESDPP